MEQCTYGDVVIVDGAWRAIADHGRDRSMIRAGPTRLSGIT